MMTAEQILIRLTNLKDVEVNIERGGYASRDKWSIKIIYNRIEGDIFDRISIEAKHLDFQHAVIEAWNKFELIALKGFGQAAITPSIEHHKTEVFPNDYRD